MMIRRDYGFTIAELLVAITVTVLLVVLMSRLLASASSVTTKSDQRFGADTQAREVFGRMAVDFAQMIKRRDVDNYLKGLDPESGNDRIAFFSQVPGYYPQSSANSPISLIAYRVNGNAGSPAYNQMERMAKGLLWNGASTSATPLIFGPTPTLQTNWPSASTGNPADASYVDPDYETIGSQVFRFEYFYQLRDGSLAIAPSAGGIRDIAAISACVAIADARSRTLLNNNQIATLASRLNDYNTSMGRAGLTAQWRQALNDTTDMPRQGVSAIRIYSRDFYLK